MKKKALVAGALGVIGRSLIQELEKRQDWEIVGISRRVPEKKGKTNYLSLDLLDRDACRKEIGQLEGITHLFYCAFQPRPTWAELSSTTAVMDMVCAAASHRLRIFGQLPDEPHHLPGSLCPGFQRTWTYLEVSRKTRRMGGNLPGLRQPPSGACDDLVRDRETSREPGFQYHQRRLLPLEKYLGQNC